MDAVPKQSLTAWQRWLQQVAGQTWGDERALALEPAIQRLAEALAAVAERPQARATRPSHER